MVEGIKAESRVEVGTLAKMAQYQNGLGKQHTERKWRFQKFFLNKNSAGYGWFCLIFP